MDRSTALAALATLTAELAPTAGTSEADLRAAREALAGSLLRHATGPGDAVQGPPAAPAPSPSPEVLAELDGIIAAATAGPSASVPLVFLRGFAGPAARQPGAHAGRGRRDDSADHRPVRRPGGRPALVRRVPCPPRPARSRRRAAGGDQQGPGGRAVPAAAACAAGRPGAGHAGGGRGQPVDRGWPARAGIARRRLPGIAISGGTLDFGTPPAAPAPGVLEVAAATTLMLTVTLNAPGGPLGGDGPGGDGGAAAVRLPDQVTFMFTQDGAQVTAFDGASLTAYGATVGLDWGRGAQAVRPALGQVLIPLSPGAPASPR